MTCPNLVPISHFGDFEEGKNRGKKWGRGRRKRFPRFFPFLEIVKTRSVDDIRPVPKITSGRYCMYCSISVTVVSWLSHLFSFHSINTNAVWNLCCCSISVTIGFIILTSVVFLLIALPLAILLARRCSKGTTGKLCRLSCCYPDRHLVDTAGWEPVLNGDTSNQVSDWSSQQTIWSQSCDW